MDVVWDRLDARDWAAALPAGAPALQQTWRYGAAAAAMGRCVHRAEIWCEGRFRGMAQLIVRRGGPVTLGCLLRGPVWHGDAPAPIGRTLQALRRCLPARGLRALLAVPETGAPGLPLLTPATVAELPLLGDRRAMRAAMHGKWRNRLARAARSRLQVTQAPATPRDIARLVAHDRAQGRRRGYRGGLPLAFLLAWHAQTGPPPRLFTARARGETVAEMLFLDHAPGASYQIGWTDATGRAEGAHRLLLWRAMQHFAAAGCCRLDLGSLDTVTAPGLARFKLGAGATARRLGTTSLLLPRPVSRLFVGSGRQVGRGAGGAA